jgi:Ca2+-transporting ATPase
MAFSQWKHLPEKLAGSPSMVLLTAMTVFHAGVVMAQVGNAFACRSEKLRGRHLGWLSNRLLFGGIAIEITIILALIYIPPLYNIFNHTPLPPQYWIGLALFAPTLYSLEWIRKGFFRILASLKEKNNHEEEQSL